MSSHDAPVLTHLPVLPRFIGLMVTRGAESAR